MPEYSRDIIEYVLYTEVFNMTTRKQLQIEFEAKCFMHEVDETRMLRESVKRFNNNEQMNKEQRINLAKAIWTE